MENLAFDCHVYCENPVVFVYECIASTHDQDNNYDQQCGYTCQNDCTILENVYIGLSIIFNTFYIVFGTFDSNFTLYPINYNSSWDEFKQYKHLERF